MIIFILQKKIGSFQIASYLVSEAWMIKSNNIVNTLQKVSLDSAGFNKEVFENIFEKEKTRNESPGNLAGLDIDSISLLVLHKDLWTKYEVILFQEETL